MLLATSFCQQATTMSAYKFTQCAVASPDAPQKPLVRKERALGVQNWVKVTWDPARQAKSQKAKSLVRPVHSNLHVPTRNTRFCPPQRPLLLQPSFGIVKCTPARLLNMNFWRPALTLIWSRR